MRLHYAALVLLVTSLLSISIAVSKETKIMNEEESNVLGTVEAMTSAFHKKDIDGVLTSYEGGAAIMFEPGTKISDPAVIRQMFEGAFQINPAYSYPQGHEVYVSNDIALHIAPWVMEGTAPDGSNIEQSGLSVAVLRKQKNGMWLLVIDNPHGQRLMKNH